MARKARQQAETGIYHVVVRGVNHSFIFEVRDDFIKFLELLEKTMEKFRITLYAYCLMDNHIHLAVREHAPSSLSQAMHVLLSQYAVWFNRKYQRSGHLFSTRYRSECVENEEYFLTVIRYIHQNPLVAGVVNNLRLYEWSSYRDYMGNKPGLVDTGFALQLFADDTVVAMLEFADFHSNIAASDDEPIPRSRKQPDELVKEALRSMLSETGLDNVSRLTRNELGYMLLRLHDQGYSVRQLGRATGISRGVIQRSIDNVMYGDKPIA